MLSVSSLVKVFTSQPSLASGLRLAAAPNNDNFANAIVLSGSSATATVSNVEATRETNEPNIAGIPGGKSVWWTWTSPVSGPVQIDTIGSNFDTTLGVYTGGSVGSLVSLAGDDDSGGSLTSKLTFSATVGTTYRIAVDGYRGRSGSVSLRVTAASIPAPTNVSASDGSFSDRVQVTWAAAAGATGYEVWRSTANNNATATKISGSDVTGTSYADTSAAATTTYYYWVKSKAGTAVSSFSSGDSGYRTGPTNDNFANAVVLSGSSVSDSSTNVGASREAGEPSIAGITGGRSVWWSWTAPSSGAVQVDTIGSTFDTILGVYTGSSVGSLSFVVGDDDAGGSGTSKVTFVATAGTTYRIGVDGYYGSTGSIKLQVRSLSVPAPTNVSASDGSFSDRIQVTWASAAGATGYEVWRSTTNDTATATKITGADVTGTSYADTSAAASTTYYYWVKSKAGSAVSGFSAGDSGSRTGPNNDNFANAIALSGSTASGRGSNLAASREVGEPNILGISGGKSVWWSWTASTSGTVQVDTIGSSFDTTLGVYTGSSVNALSLVASDDDGGGSLTSKVTFSVTAGTTYRIGVDGYAGSAGSVVLNVVQRAAPVVATAAAATSSGLRTAALSVLGSDASGESQLTYSWSASAVPQGAAAPTFSVNGTNAAKNTTATFSAAGNYTFSVRIASGAGLSCTSTVSYQVTQTAAGAVITPASPTIDVNAQRQFTAQNIDQFGNAMATQPTFTWSATAGTITSTGLYTAPSTISTVTITASSSTTTASTTVSVGSNFLGLQNADLAGLLRSLYTDGSINRLDMYQILMSVGQNDGTVTASEISDLRTILSASNVTSLGIPGYVQVLANSVVLGSAANARYQGQALGNLFAGYTADQMSKLVNKWFKGSDRPAANANGSYGYQLAAGTLFVNGPSYTDMHQGYLGDCYYIATLGSIAKSNPAAIQNMFVDNGDGTFTVRFYYPTNGTFTADYVTVDRYLPVSGSTFIYSNMGSSYSSSSNELWMPLAEKAYAQWNETGREGRDGTNRYSAIEGGWMSNVNRQVLGRASSDYWFSNNANKQIFIDAINANKGVTLGTSSSSFGLVGGHAYTVIGYNAGTDTFQAYNPWGTTHPGPLTWSQLQQSCSVFTVADTSNVPVISGFRGTVIAPPPTGGSLTSGEIVVTQVGAARSATASALARLSSSGAAAAATAVSDGAVEKAFAAWDRVPYRFQSVRVAAVEAQRSTDGDSQGEDGFAVIGVSLTGDGWSEVG